MEFVLGGVAAMGAGLFSNPFDVVKTRMQLQGELQRHGHYSVHYMNVPHAMYVIATRDGILALQKGLVPALGFQLFCNSTRLGMYELADNHSLTRNAAGKVDPLKSCLWGSLAGAAGAFVASPFYLIKVHMQSSSDASIAVGHQHHYSSASGAFLGVYRSGGLKGLWRGVESAIPRASVGSAVQLTAFVASKDALVEYHAFAARPTATAFVASNASALGMVVFMSPFDVISTRLYNQNENGRLYGGVLDCARKIVAVEGVTGLYKGIGPLYLRVAPHTILNLVFWDALKRTFLTI